VTRPGACGQRTESRGGAGIAWISSMVVIVGGCGERKFCDRLKDPATARAAGGRRNLKKSRTDKFLLGRTTFNISGGI